MQVELKLKNIDTAIVEQLKSEADHRGMDLNTFVLSIFKRELGLEHQNKQDNLYRDLDYLAGTWSKEEAEEFLKSIEDFNKIDDELWT